MMEPETISTDGYIGIVVSAIAIFFLIKFAIKIQKTPTIPSTNPKPINNNTNNSTKNIVFTIIKVAAIFTTIGILNTYSNSSGTVFMFIDLPLIFILSYIVNNNSAIKSFPLKGNTFLSFLSKSSPIYGNL